MTDSLLISVCLLICLFVEQRLNLRIRVFKKVLKGLFDQPVLRWTAILLSKEKTSGSKGSVVRTRNYCYITLHRLCKGSFG